LQLFKIKRHKCFHSIQKYLQDFRMVACAVLKLEPKSEMSVKLHSNIISGATDGLVYARNGPLQQVVGGGVS
jgi:hypothetical protein